MAMSRCWRSWPADPRLRTCRRPVKIRYRASPGLVLALQGHEKVRAGRGLAASLALAGLAD